jgi:small subunit ribosomal protein S6
MRKYEMTLILVPEIAATKKKEVLDKVEKILVATKGKVEKKEEWGKKSLAYPIKKMTEGDYHFWEVALPEPAPAEIDKKMRLENEVLRYLLLRKE